MRRGRDGEEASSHHLQQRYGNAEAPLAAAVGEHPAIGGHHQARAARSDRDHAYRCRTSGEPPLDFASGSFDLIWALSVFTHLTDNSLPWLAELHRTLRPGGLLIASYMGRFNGWLLTDEEWDEDRVGMNVLRRDQGWDDGGPVVLMSDWWVQEHWGRGFEIVKLDLVHGQTWALLRRKDLEITANDLAELSDDPREITALRHNISQVERDRIRVISEVRNHYEHSLSWRLTRPLRTGRDALRRAIHAVQTTGWSRPMSPTSASAPSRLLSPVGLAELCNPRRSRRRSRLGRGP